MSDNDKTSTTAPIPPTRPSRPSVRRSNRVQRSKSEREARRESRRKHREEVLEGSCRTAAKEDNQSSRAPRRTRTTTSRHLDDESGPRFGRSRTAPEAEVNVDNSDHATHFRRSKTTTDVVTSTQRRSFQEQRTSASSATKELLDSLPAEDEETHGRDSVTLDSFAKGIQMASSMHCSRRVVGKRVHGHDSSVRLSACSRHQPTTRSSHNTGNRRHRRGRAPSRRRTAPEPEGDERIRLLQFDCEQADGLNVVDANKVFCKTGRNSALLQEDLSEAVTEDTASLENSFSSVQEPLMFSASEDSNDDEEPTEIKTTKNKSKTAFKKVSKMLATPVRRMSVVMKPKDMEPMDLSNASLNI